VSGLGSRRLVSLRQRAGGSARPPRCSEPPVAFAAREHTQSAPVGPPAAASRRRENAGHAGQDMPPVDLESTDILQIELLRRAAKETGKLRNRMDIRSLSGRRQIADCHVVDHTPAQRAHLGHRRSSVSGLGGSIPTLAHRERRSCLYPREALTPPQRFSSISTLNSSSHSAGPGGLHPRRGRTAGSDAGWSGSESQMQHCMRSRRPRFLHSLDGPITIRQPGESGEAFMR
jgi:hypothetical protein